MEGHEEKGLEERWATGGLSSVSQQVYAHSLLAGFDPCASKTPGAMTAFWGYMLEVEMQIKYDGLNSIHTITITDTELEAGGIAKLVKSLADVSVEHGDIPTYDSTRAKISGCGVMKHEDHQSEYLPDKYVYVY